MATASTHETIERSIIFYKVFCGIQESLEPDPFDFAAVLKHIESLPFAFNSGGRFLSDRPGQYLCGWVDSASTLTNDVGRLQLATVRQDNLPQIQRGARLRPIDLEPDDGLAESTYIVFFPDNVMGMVYNHLGPRVGACRRYLESKARSILPGSLAIRPLVKADTIAELRELGRPRALTIAVEPDILEKIGPQNKSVSRFFETTSEVVPGAATISFGASMGHNMKGRLPVEIIEMLANLLTDPEFVSGCKTLKVRGELPGSGVVDWLDLLKNHLVATARVVRQQPRYRALDSASAFNAVEIAYNSLHDQIKAARTLT